jgi:hypothetical protein
LMPGGKKSIRRCANISVESLALLYSKVWVFGILGSADAALEWHKVVRPLCQMPIRLGPMPKDSASPSNIHIEQATARSTFTSKGSYGHEPNDLWRKYAG